MPTNKSTEEWVREDAAEDRLMDQLGEGGGDDNLDGDTVGDDGDPLSIGADD